VVKWSEIEAECGDYRQGFVQVFRRYEGQVTDRKDSLNRPIKVTISSFAEHFGIQVTTFRRWLGERQRTSPVSDRPARRAARMVRTSEDRRELVRELMADEELQHEALKVMAAGPEGKELTRSIKAREAQRTEEPPEGAVGSWEIAAAALSLGGLREMVERALRFGWKGPGDTPQQARFLAEALRHIAQMLDAAASGETELTDEDVERLLSGGGR
jgi:transposase-like protein